MKTYRIIRIYKDVDKTEIVKTGLTEEEAKAHCSDKRTSSSGCEDEEGKARTAQFGEWMDCFEDEEIFPKRNISNIKSPLSIFTAKSGWNW